MHMTTQTDLRCGVSTCNAPNALACGYVDRTGRSCGFPTCLEHGTTINEVHYCRRHAAILDALGIENPSGYELPSLDNRNVSLVAALSTDLDASIRDILEHNALTDEHLVWDRHVKAVTDSQQKIFWQKAWALTSEKGPTITIAIAAPDDIDAQVLVTANSRPISVGIPTWIQSRRKGSHLPPGVDSLERQLYGDFVLEVVRKGIADVRSGHVRRRTTDR